MVELDVILTSPLCEFLQAAVVPFEHQACRPPAFSCWFSQDVGHALTHVRHMPLVAL